MDDDKPSDEAGALWRETLESVGEGKLADRDELTVKEAFRLQQKLAAGVATTTRTFTLTFSLHDIERLTDVPKTELPAVRREWRDWYEALGPVGAFLWCAAAAVAWAAIVRTAVPQVWLQPWVGAVPAGVLYAVGGLAAVAVFMNVPQMINSLDYWTSYENYYRGYRDGLRKGVMRTLRITAEQEREMWDGIHEARIAQSHLDRWATEDASVVGEKQSESE